MPSLLLFGVLNFSFSYDNVIALCVNKNLKYVSWIPKRKIIPLNALIIQYKLDKKTNLFFLVALLSGVKHLVCFVQSFSQYRVGIN